MNFAGLIVCLSMLFAFTVPAPVHADDAVDQMARELDLTKEQAAAIKPIVKESIEKRQAYMDQEGNLFSDKKAIRAAMLKFRDEEDKQLRQILSEDQMNKLRRKRRVRESLNKDKVDFSDAFGSGGVGLDGATMAF